MVKRRRAPGAGRKLLGPEPKTAPVKVRLEPAQLMELKKLAGKHRLRLSVLVRAAITSWVLRRRKHRGHIEALADSVALLVAEIERHTGKRWISDPETGVAVSEEIERLAFHFAPTPTDPVTVPDEVRAITGMVISMIENAAPPSRELAHIWHTGADPELATIRREFGSGWKRNRARWEGMR
jgi:hypothetical protein